MIIRSHRIVATAVRWTARILSLLILGFWGFFIAAHIFGGEGGSSRSLTMDDYVGLTMMGLWLVGLAAAWKREVFGGGLALAAYVTLAAAQNPNVLSLDHLAHDPITIIPVTALLFLASGWMNRESSGEVLPGAA